MIQIINMIQIIIITL